ncbi:MAG: PGF-CTERM-anchored ABC transporter substrate-binding protein [Halobacteriales archaeon]
MQLRATVLSLVLILAVLPGTAAGTAASPSHGCTFPITVTDATGTQITVEKGAERVVTLNPSAAQIMWEIGAQEKVVGLSKYASYLNGSENRTVISGEEQVVVFEKVVDLDPDIVLAPNTTSADTIEKLREAGLTVYHFERDTSIKDVYERVLVVGRLVGECDEAQATVNWMQERIGVVQEAVEGQERPDALYLFFGYTAGSGTFINEIIETAGANNLAADAGIQSYQQISPEVVVEQDPDWIILNSNDPALPESDAYNETTAVQEGQVVVVQIEHLNQPAPRIVYAITKLAKAFHPEAYAAANATPTPSPTPTTAMTDTASPTPPATITDTASPGQSGFGFLVGLLAVLLTMVTLVRRRR